MSIRSEGTARFALPALLALGTLIGSPASSWAQDKSGAKDGLVKLPAAGGTVTAEGSTFLVQGNTGAANYTMPLPALPGRGGVVPSVTLTYNQMNGDAASGFGSGWYLDVPSVEVSTEFGVPYATAFAAGDNIFRFHGERLLADPTRPGQYRLETADGDIRVRYYGSPFTVAWAKPVDKLVPSIPSGFEVVYPDGKVELYSGDPAVAEGAGNLITRFPLVYEVHRQGESIAYTYVKAFNKAYLSEIAFASGLSRYKFDLMDATPNVATYKQGFRQTNGKLVQRMVASYGGNVRNRWCFVYVGPTGKGGLATAPECTAAAAQDTTLLGNDAPVHDRLVSVLRYGNTVAPTASSPHEPRMKFEYSSWNANELAARQLVYPAPSLLAPGIDAASFELLDANRDGLPDVVQAVDNQPTQVLFGNADLGRAFATQTPVVLKREDGADVTLDLRHNGFQVADINGDSFVDLLEFDSGNIHVYGGAAYIDQAEPYVWRQTIATTDFNADTFNNGAALFIDLNQDGQSDIVTTTSDQQWLVELNTTFVDPSGNWQVSFSPLQYALPLAGMGTSSGGPLLTDARSFKILDVNGDGLPDFTWTNAAQSFMCVYENTGAFFQNPAPSTLLFGRSELADPVCGHGVKVDLAIPEAARDLDTWILDVNGDGLKDFVSLGNTVLVAGKPASELNVWYGQGDLHFKGPVTLGLKALVTPGDGARSRVADIDGDGQEEIVVFQPAPSGQQSVVILDFNRTPDTQLIKSGLLTASETEAGVRHDIRYATSTDEMARDVNVQGQSAFYPLHFPVIVAKQVVTSTGTHNDQLWTDVDVTEYFYHQPYYDAVDRNFRGFKKVDQLVLGDEGLKNTQETAFVEETFATATATPLDRRLWGRSLSKRVSAVAPSDAMILAKIKDTNSFDPRSAVLHSLSTATQNQQLAHASRLLEETQSTWSLTPQVPNGGAYFARLQGSTTTAHGSTDASALRTTVKTATYDEHNMATAEQESTTWAGVPLNVTLPPFQKVTERDYDQARTALQSFEAVSLPCEERTTINGALVGRVHTDYDAASGLVSATHRTVFATPPADALLVRAAGPDAALLARLRALAVSQGEELSAFGYDAYGNPTSRSDAIGLAEQVRYDASGVMPVEYHKVNLDKRSLDQVTTMTYQTDGRLATYVNSLGLASSLQYDELGRRKELQFSDGGDETYQYRLAVDGLPSLILTTSRRYPNAAAVPPGETETVSRLAAYRADGVELGEAENAENGSVRVLSFHTYNRKKNRVLTYTPYLATRFGNRSSLTTQDLFDLGQIPAPEQADQPDNVGTRFRYDPLDRVSLQSLPSGKQIATTHEPWGEIETETYPIAAGSSVTRSRTLREVRSPLGILARVEEGENQSITTRFGRDGLGHLTSILLDGERTPRLFAFDTTGNQVYQRVPGVGEIHSLHDVRGRLAVKLDVSKDGQRIVVTEHAYDSCDRPTEVWEGGRLVEERVYDDYPTAYHPTGELSPHVALPIGQLTVSRSFDLNNLYDHEERLGYDARGKVVNRTALLGQRTFVENFGYTLDGANTVIVTPRGLRENLALNQANRLRAVSVQGASFAAPESVIEQVTYNAKNKIAQLDYRRGAQTKIDYDPQTLLVTHIASSFVASAGAAPLQDLAYDIDGDLKITAIHDAIRQSEFGSVDRSGTFGYDWRGQLVSATRYQRTTNYAYDHAGGFTANDELPGTWRTADETGLLPLGTTQNAFDFDGFGRLVKSPEIAEARYDGAGQLIHVRTTSGQEISYGYANSGQRYYKRVVAANGEVRESLYPVPSYIEEPSGAQSFVFVGNKRLVRFDHGQGTDPDRWYYYLTDHLGSSDVLMSANGKPVEQNLYFPYGSEAKASDLSSSWTSYLAANAELAPAEKTHHRFTGHYLDDETGLYYFGARYYHPKLGRFVTPDPLFMGDPQRCEKDPLDCSLYVYAKNNPLAYVDPDGFAPVVPVDPVRVLPDRVGHVAGSSAETTIGVQGPRFTWRVARDGTVTDLKVVGSVKITIQTTYNPDSHGKMDGTKNGQSAYGVGTRPDDAKNGTTKLSDHEDSHKADYKAFVASNPLPTFNGDNGMTEKDVKQAIKDYGDALGTYTKAAETDSKQKTDCVGTKMSGCP